MQQFFKKYLPLLEDIDSRYNPNNNYTDCIGLFIQDLQKFENFNETYEVYRNLIKINFITYNMLMNLMKNVKSEKITKIQTLYRGHICRKFIKHIKKCTLKIQQSWKYHYYNNSAAKDYEKFNLYLKKYNKSDPVLLRIFNRMYKNIDNLVFENKRLESLLIHYQKENSTVKSHRSQSTQRDSIPKTISLSKYHGSRTSIMSNASSMTSIRGSSSKKNRNSSIDGTASSIHVKSLMESLEVFVFVYLE
jgi:hypothetical protein